MLHIFIPAHHRRPPRHTHYHHYTFAETAVSAPPRLLLWRVSKLCKIKGRGKVLLEMFSAEPHGAEETLDTSGR